MYNYTECYYYIQCRGKFPPPPKLGWDCSVHCAHQIYTFTKCYNISLALSWKFPNEELVQDNGRVRRRASTWEGEKDDLKNKRDDVDEDSDEDSDDDDESKDGTAESDIEDDNHEDDVDSDMEHNGKQEEKSLQETMVSVSVVKC